MADQSQEYIVWKSGSRHFALEIIHCREIFRDIPLTPLPHAPAFLCGLANVRGSVVAAVDLERLLEKQQKRTYAERVTLVRLRSPGYPVAVLADEILDTLFVAAQQLEDVPANLAEAEDSCLRKIARTPLGLVLIPDVEKIAKKIN
ncbi:MAG: chemotaxis protein CheW [Leptospiraceae bacterium]|nr:chemotaxis protein CheW [Leptospiraceae bacterium]